MKRKEKILIVDDEPETLQLLKKFLNHEKYEVIEAINAEEALDILENREVNLVISDLRMPGMSGAEFINELREWDTELPVIFMSGWAKEKDWLEAIHSHASDFISKPFTKDAILKAVHKAIHEKETTAK